MADEGRLSAEWDDRYRSQPRLFRPAPDETLVELVSALPAGTALDLGAGEGRNGLWLARAGWDVVAVDVSEVALERLRAVAEPEGLSIDAVRGDVFEYLRSASRHHVGFDLVVIAFLHPPAAERTRLLSAAGAALAPSGHLFVVAHHRDSLGMAGPPDPERLYTEDDLRAIDDELEILRLERRTGASDVEHPGVDVVLWARRPQTP